MILMYDQFVLALSVAEGCLCRYSSVYMHTLKVDTYLSL